MDERRFLTFAKEAVANYFNGRVESTDKNGKITVDDVFVVWFCKTLQNSKALLSTNVSDGMYYELTALPVSPEGKAKERREKEAEAKQQTEYTIDDVVSEVQNLAAEMAAGFIEMRKDKASAQKQDDLYELIRNTAKMIHTDFMTLVQAVRGDTQ